jgi:hypothetical protein
MEVFLSYTFMARDSGRQIRTRKYCFSKAGLKDPLGRLLEFRCRAVTEGSVEDPLFHGL